MDESITMQGTEQTTQTTTATETQETQAAESTPEKLNVLQKFISGLFGGGKDTNGAASEKNEEIAEGGAAEEQTFTKAEMETTIEAEKQKWLNEAAEAERVKNLTPEEKVAEEQKKKDTEIESLKSQLLKKELKEAATKALEKDGFPVGLAGVLDYSSKERMEETLKSTIEVFKESLAGAIQTRLKGKTPEGLGGAASSENLIRDQIAKNIRGL